MNLTAANEEMFHYAEALSKSTAELLVIYTSLAKRPTPVPRVSKAWVSLNNDSESAARLVAAGKKKTRFEMQARFNTKDKRDLRVFLSKEEESDAQMFQNKADAGALKSAQGPTEWKKFVAGMLDAVNKIETISADF